MKKHITRMLDELAPNSVVFNVATDGASNVRNTATLLVGRDSVHCLDHQLNLIVSSVLEKHSILLEKIRTNIKTVRNSKNHRTLLRQSQTTPSLLGRNADDGPSDDEAHSLEEDESETVLPQARPLMLLIDVETRWNSMYLAINRFLKLLPLLQALETSLNPLWTIQLPSQEDLATASILRNSLEPFYDNTKISQSMRFPTLGFVPAWVEYLVTTLKSLERASTGPAHQVISELRRETESRFSYLWDTTDESESEEAQTSKKAGLSTLLVSAFLPQFGQLPFSRVAAELRNAVWEKVERDANLLVFSSPQSSPSTPEWSDMAVLPIIDGDRDDTDESATRLKIALASVRRYWKSLEHRSFLANLTEKERRFLYPMRWWEKNHIKFDEIIYPFVQGLLSAPRHQRCC